MAVLPQQRETSRTRAPQSILTCTLFDPREPDWRHCSSSKTALSGRAANLLISMTFSLCVPARPTERASTRGIWHGRVLFTALVLFSRRGEKIGTAGITKAKECAELVLVNGRGGRGRICRDEIAFAHHREGNGISDLDNGMPRKAQGGSLGKMVVSRSLLEQLADLTARQ